MKQLPHFHKLNIREHLRLRRPRQKSSLKKKIMRGSAATLTGVSILAASLFSTPSDLMQKQTIDQLGNDTAVEIMIDEPASDESDFTDEDSESTPSRKSIFSRIRNRLRQFILELPQAVKACVCVPLWAAGYVIIHLLSLLYSTFLAPVLSHILGLLLIAAVLLGVFTVTMKCLFPHMPLRKILSKRNILILLIGAIVLKAVDLVMPLFWNDYTRFKHLVLLAVGLVFLGIVFRRILKHYKKKARKDQTGQLPEDSPEPELITQYYYEDTLLLEGGSQQQNSNAAGRVSSPEYHTAAKHPS